MTARLGGTLGLALLAAGWIGAAQPGRVPVASGARPAAARPAAAGPQAAGAQAAEATAAARLRAGAREWILRAGAYQRRG